MVDNQIRVRVTPELQRQIETRASELHVSVQDVTRMTLAVGMAHLFGDASILPPGLYPRGAASEATARGQ